MIAFDSAGRAAPCDVAGGGATALLFGAVTSAVRASGTDAGAGTELEETANSGAGAASRSEGAFIHTTTATTDTVATGTSQRIVEACHHLRVECGVAVFAIAASIA